MGPSEVLSLQIKVDMGRMAMKVYSTLLRALKLKPHQKMELSVMLRTPLEKTGSQPLYRGYNQYILSSDRGDETMIIIEKVQVKTKKKKDCNGILQIKIVIIIKHLQINQISVLNNP